MVSVTELTKKTATRLSPLLLLALLAACGGGGSGDDGTATNQKPTADAGEVQSVDARTEVALTGSGADSDGSIASFAWEQTAGPTVTMTSADTAEPTFTAPEVNSADVLTFQLTVTDNGGESATDTVDVTVAPVITLSGQVYDGPIADATITVTVGDRTYTATADANGVYTIDIGAIDPDAFITITATGGEGQEHVELVSIAGSFAALSTAAGDDGVLETTESGNVNVTNLSTAKAVLMIQANGGNDITDDATLTTAESNVSGDDLLYLATVIKLIVDGGYTLPTGVTSTLDLVKDSTKTDAFVTAVDADDATAFETQYNNIVSDPKLVAAFTAANVPATLFTLYVSSNDNESETYRTVNRGKSWAFGTGGRGTRSDAENASVGFDWTVTGGKIVITYDAPLASAGNCTHPDVDTGELFYCESTTTGTTMTMLVDGATADTLLLSSTGETIYPDDAGLAQPIAMTGGSTNLGLQKSAAIPFTAEEVPGRWITTTTGRADPSLSGVMYTALDTGFVEFASDGSGTRMATDYSDPEAFTWSITGGVLKVAYVGGDTVHYYRLRHDGDVYDTLALMTRHEEGNQHSEAGLMLEVEVDRLPLLALEDIPGRYTLYEVENDFSIRFDETGTGNNEFYNESGPFNSNGFSWTLREDYVVSMSYNWDPGAGNVATCIDPATCHHWMDRLWYPAAYNDVTGRVYVLEIQQYYAYDDAAVESKGALDYYQPTVRYFGRSELAATGGLDKPSAPAMPSRANRMAEILGSPMTNGR